MALLSNGLLPGSFRGVPFAVQASGLGGGRRLAMHIYPGRDEPLAEDLGRAPRTFRLRGFLVEGDLVYLGGPIVLQRALLLAALEKSGPGTLTHPTVGVVSASVSVFSISEELDASRRSSFEIEFKESGKQVYPSILTSSSGLLTAANLCTVALAVDGIRLIAAAASAGATRSDVSGAAASWGDQTVALGSDATALHRLAAQLPGNYGRYAGGGNVGLSGQLTTPYTTSTTIADLISIASASRVVISTAAAALISAVASVDLSNAATIATAITDLVAALADACADPSDTIRLLEQLIGFVPADFYVGTPIGTALAGMFQRAAAGALATAIGAYQPTSADDAAALMRRVANLLDNIALEAGDAGDDQSYAALRAIRVAIVQDLRSRGGNLAQVTSYAFGQGLPALMLAQRLYRDPGRADQLVGQVDPVHPLFMPASFDALAA